MSLRKSILMLGNTGVNWNITGDPIRADSYYGYTDGKMTAQVTYRNLVGGIGFQATLALDPQPEDWFWITINPTNSSNPNLVTFPIDSMHPTGANGGDTGSKAFVFIGNYTFIRAVLTRDYIQSAPTNPTWDVWTVGQVDKVLLAL